MTESLASNDPGAQKRRSTRITQAVPITVTGVDALGQPFKERTTTVMVNCHGCKYQSKHYVPKNSTVMLEIPRAQGSLPSRTIEGHVIWVQRPRTVRELFQIGLEFDVAGNIWGIAFPPDDWFPYPDDVSAETAEAPAEQLPHLSAAHGKLTDTSATPSEQVAPAASAANMPAPDKIHVVPPQPAAPSQDAQLANTRQMSKMAAEAKETLDKMMRRSAQSAINEEMTVVRQQLDAQLHEAVERAIKVSMERVSESAVRKVVQQAADRTHAIVEEARKTTAASAQQLDSKVRQAVEEAVGQAAQQAAQQAAEQAATLNLKHTVEQVVERVITEREAYSPSLQILSSPEAAQAQLDQWKKNLEEAAQVTRNQALEQTKTEVSAATQQMKQEFESALANATGTIGDKLTTAAEAVLQTAEEDFAARSVGLRARLDEALTGAQAAVESATTEARSAARSIMETLEAERARTKSTQEELRQTAQSALEDARHQFDQLLASRQDEIARRADEVINDRTRHIEPILRNSAEKVLDHFSGEMDRKLAPQIATTQRAIDELNRAAQQASQIQDHIRERAHEASEQAVQETVAHMRQEMAKVPAEVDESVRATLSKAQQELDQRASETQHETFEALMKASEWYQKKAHTTMQSALEKAVEQSTVSLRDHAAEISSLAASELDHQRRAYVNHAQAQIEEGAKEVVERERGKLIENAQMASAGFTNRVNELTADSFKRFEESSRAALEKVRAEMGSTSDGSLAQYQEKLEERILQGVELARTQLQSQLVPLMEEWDAERESEKRMWMEQLKKQTDESIEQYKSRLENASNSWLLASAATLGQNSQAMLDTLARSAEKRIRETCAEVLAGMGDTIKERLLGLSTGFTPADENDDPSSALPKKKL